DVKVMLEEDEQVELVPAQLPQCLVPRELGQQERLDSIQYLDELRAPLILRLIVDGDRHPTEVAEVQVAKDHHQHQRHDQAEEECRAVAQVGAKEEAEEAEGLPHASRIS